MSRTTTDTYEIGYGKPPKNTQFQKGVSGNPRGRPRKIMDYDHELIKESNSIVIVNENGRPTRISKHRLIVKQVINQAIKGNQHALRSYLTQRQHALEKVTLLEEHKAAERERWIHPESLTDAELMAIARLGLPDNQTTDITDPSVPESQEPAQHAGSTDEETAAQALPKTEDEG